MKTIYKKNYLKSVIARIDFLSPINSLKEEFPSDVGSVIKDFFPIAEPQGILAIDLQLRKEELEDGKRRKSTDWDFYGKDRDKILSIREGYMFISYNAYQSFEDLETPFIRIVDALYNKFKEIQTIRLGLRYINRIDIKEIHPLDWASYINKDLLPPLNIVEDKTKISRAFNNIDINYGEFNLKFQYGMHNPDFPAPIKQKIFILDYDTNCQGFLNRDDITKNLSIFHKEIGKLFEKSITQELRKKMNE